MKKREKLPCDFVTPFNTSLKFSTHFEIHEILITQTTCLMRHSKRIHLGIKGQFSMLTATKRVSLLVDF